MTVDPYGDAAARRAHRRRIIYADAHHAATERTRNRHLEEFTRLLREELVRRGYLPPLPPIQQGGGERLEPEVLIGDLDAPDPAAPAPPLEVCAGPDCGLVLTEFRAYPRYCSDRCMLRSVAASLDDDDDQEPPDAQPAASC